MSESQPIAGAAVRYDVSLLTPYDVYLYTQGAHHDIYEKLGAHPLVVDGMAGTQFAIWAPNARFVSVCGDFNGWAHHTHPLGRRDDGSGIWEGFVTGVIEGALYKYWIESQHDNYRVEKADPLAFCAELRPRTGSVVYALGNYAWGDGEWMAERYKRNALAAPMSIYEVHLGSWMRVPEEEDRWLTYRELATRLVAYVVEMGYTHVELLPVMEHPLDMSWGYQVTGYYAPTRRFGEPDELMYLIDALHQANIGVILDWVPAHFPRDEIGLAYLDGTHLYEHADPRQGAQQDWGTLIFNYGRYEVRNFLLSNAMFWLRYYHVDGFRVDAVTSMVRLDFARGPGEWVPNDEGGPENLEAVRFLQRMNMAVYERHPDVVTIAEESTDWARVSRPVYLGGLGFGLKWNMGWMHDTLDYMALDPIHRSYHHNKMTFSLMYAFGENFVLPFSHDEVVHLKGSMLTKMPGDEWQRFANLRLLYGYMFGHPGKKLMFMGGEFGQWREWGYDRSLDWDLLERAGHRGLSAWVRDLNAFYAQEPALWAYDFEPRGFRWIDANDNANNVLTFLRFGDTPQDAVLVACNFSPVVRYGYEVGAPLAGAWRELLNSDAVVYGGSGVGNLGQVVASDRGRHGCPYSLALTLPPLATIMLKPQARPGGATRSPAAEAK